MDITLYKETGIKTDKNPSRNPNKRIIKELNKYKHLWTNAWERR